MALLLFSGLLILPLIRTLYCWVFSKEVSSTILKSLVWIELGLNPGLSWPLVSSLSTRLMSDIRLVFASIDRGEMEQIQLVCGLHKEAVIVILFLYKNMKAMVCLPEDDTCDTIGSIHFRLCWRRSENLFVCFGVKPTQRAWGEDRPGDWKWRREGRFQRRQRDSVDKGTIYQPLRSGRIWHKVNF